VQAIVLAIVYVIPVVFALRFDGVNDTDVWWHLAVGDWITQHRAIPHTEPFSALTAGKPWEAYSWLFELIVFWLHQKFGLLGIVLYSSTMVIAITAAVHHLLRRLNADFALGIGITILAMYTMGRLYTPRPWLITILLFVLELDILMWARKTGETRELWWLPLIFAVWVNIHIQFADGLVVLGIALAEPIVADRFPAIQSKLRVRRMMIVFLACVAATFVNPYGLRIYKIAYDLVSQAASLDQLIELSAISFRNLDDWCVLFFALAGTYVLAKAKRPVFFECLLLVSSIIISFHAQRDIWMLAVVGSAILVANLNENLSNRLTVKASTAPIVAVATVLFAAIEFAAAGVNNARLQQKLENDLPVRAVETIKQQGWSGPIYNDYNWGGFLIWTLHKPVSFYGRNTVFGVEEVLRSNATWNGYPGWDSDPVLLRANLIISPKGAPLVQLLRLQPCLELAYQDQLAAVFIDRRDSKAETAPVTTPFCAAREKRPADSAK